VCGLVTDFCVLDTCVNGKANGFDEAWAVLDASRPTHTHGVGQFGSGFLSDPQEVAQKFKRAGAGLCSFTRFVDSNKLPMSLDTQGAAFPTDLQPISLSTAAVSVTLDGASRQYTLKLEGELGELLKEIFPADTTTAVHGPPAPIPSDFLPNVSKKAVEICWAYPTAMKALGAAANSPSGKSPVKNVLAFSSVSKSSELCFAAYGGFLLLDEQRKVLSVLVVRRASEEEPVGTIRFTEPREWRQEFVAPLQEDNRLQTVTLPHLKRNGARKFCWIGPGEELAMGPERWIPSATGGFMYVREEGPPLYFAADAAPLPQSYYDNRLSGKADPSALLAKVEKMELEIAQLEKQLEAARTVAPSDGAAGVDGVSSQRGPPRRTMFGRIFGDRTQRGQRVSSNVQRL